ncbi:MAG: hypothetical protein IJ485_06680 [Lachnospiraceae bacterium]|nr:hypothetical protein [Lachnospiraceae bacterium]
MITTLIVMALLVILATSILAVSTMNLRTKMMDYKIKANFYSNEGFLNDIYNGIGQEATVCFEKAYTDVLREINTKDALGNPLYPTEESAYQEFCRRFILNLQHSFPASNLTAVMETLNRYATKYQVDASGNQAATNPVMVIGLDGINAVDCADASQKEFIFEKLVVVYNDYRLSGEATGYQTAITTDIVVKMPYVSFFDTPDYMADYALIANKGIYFHQGGNRNVTGNVYAGIAPDAPKDSAGCEKDINGGIQVSGTDVTINGQYIVSKGDINVRKGTLTVENNHDTDACNVWAESIRTTEGLTRYDASEYAEIVIAGNTYVANDLELNSYNSNVTLSGSFYGYNNGVYATKENSVLGTTVRHTESSAIIVNEKNAKLDLTDLDTLFISGLAYIDMKEGKEHNTGESLALQTNQFMYLVPTEFLETSNPVPVSEAPDIDVNHVAIHVSPGWFAEGYLDDTVKAVAKKVTTAEGMELYYFYLNFKAGMERKYAQEILNVTQEMVDAANDSEKLQLKWKLDLKNALQEKALQAGYQAIEINQDADCRVYGLGAITQLNEDHHLFAVELPDGGDNVGTGIGTDYVTLLGQPLGYRYQHLYYYLDPQEQYALTSQKIAAPAVSSEEMTTLPVSRYVDMTAIGANNPTGTASVSSGGTGYETDDEYATVIVNSSYTVPGGTDFKGIILATGDVTIQNNANVEGLVIANGKIYLEGNGTITASRAIVQAIVEEEIKTEQAKTKEETHNKNYACHYLKTYQSKAVHTGMSTEARQENSTDYANYIQYRNWKKGGN